MKIAFHDSNLTDAQWEWIQPMLPTRPPRVAPPTALLRVLDPILCWWSNTSPRVFVAVESDSTRRSRFNKSYSLRVVMAVRLGFASIQA